MEYSVYKFIFQTGVHFGKGMLNGTSYIFQADTLFSALYIEALKFGTEDKLLSFVKDGKLLLSDGLPFIRNMYMLPKPNMFIKSKKSEDLIENKKLKKLLYIPAEKFEDFANGTINFNDNSIPDFKDFGLSISRSMACIRTGTDPFHVKTYYYGKDNGIYIIVGYEDESVRMYIEELIESLSYTGIGGKKSSGLGKFEFIMAKKTESLDNVFKLINKKSDKYMLLSCALPDNEEMENVLINASYKLEKKSGFIASDKYSDEFRKKKDLYVFSAGSCFENKFKGIVADVSNGGRHPVYRYAKAMFLGV